MTPTDIKVRVRKGRPKHPWDIEKAFIRDEIERWLDHLEYIVSEYRKKLSRNSKGVSFFDRIRFFKLLNQTSTRLYHKIRTKKDRTLHWLIRTQVGNGQLHHSTIINLSDIELTEIQKNVLCRGLNFGIPPKLSHEKVKAEFELGWQQLNRTKTSTEQSEQCRATLGGLAHKYANARIDRTGFPLDKEHMAALRELRRNDDIVITRPDKGNGVVILNKKDYVKKMHIILGQEGKFQHLGPVEDNDRTVQQERALQAYLLRQRKAGHITEEVYVRIRPVGATRPRMYGVPKVHKQGVPLRPILSMTNAPQHELAKWLAELLKPVLDKYNEHTVRDTFQFCENIEKFASERDVDRMYMCSFDVISLFTNIPLSRTIEICLDTLYRDDDMTAPVIPEAVLKKLLLKATTEVEFSFDNVMYRQIDGVAMGSPLGPVLANIFVGYCETLIPPDRWPEFYNRFVDDTLAVFTKQAESEEFLVLLNGLHPSLKFTVEGESNNTIPFMDVQLQHNGGQLIRSIYRKPTFTGLYTRWDSFAPTYQKINLIRSLTTRAVRICSPSTVEAELSKLQSIFVENGYPVNVVHRIMGNTRDNIKMKQEHATANETVPGCGEQVGPITVCLPWIGQHSMKFRRDIVETMKRGFPLAAPRVVFTTTKAFSGRAKDILPEKSRSFVVYEYSCCCGQHYVGKTTQRFSERIKQHVPSRILKSPPDRRKGKSDSAITDHLKSNIKCIGDFESMNGRFRSLAQARNRPHLDILEALYIAKMSPSLCRQKEHVRALSLA